MIIMKQQTSITAARRERKIGILTCLATILCIGISFGYIRYSRGYRQFRVPEHEAAAETGMPELTEAYQELPVKEGYVVGICTTPVCEGKTLHLDVANKSDNSVWFLVRVYKEDQLIAKSGILYQGEYLADLPCDTSLQAEDEILVQIVAYEPETYHSEGVARISCKTASK